MKYFKLLFLLLIANASMGQWIEKVDTHFGTPCPSNYARSMTMLNDSVGYRLWYDTPSPSNQSLKYANIINYGNCPIQAPTWTTDPVWACTSSSTTPYYAMQYVSGPWKLQLFDLDTLLYVETEYGFISKIHQSFDALESDSIIFTTGENETISDYYFFDLQHGLINTSAASASTDLLIEYNNGNLDTLQSYTMSYSTDIQFLNSSLGFLQRQDFITNKTQLMKSIDTGQNWIPVVDSLSDHLSSIKFVTDSIGFVTLNDNSILRTLDQGDSWNLLPFDYNRFQGVYEFVTEDLWYAVQTPDSLFKSYNQGQDWEYDSLSFNNITDIAIRSDSIGYAIGNTCRLYTKGKNEVDTSVDEFNFEKTEFKLYPNPATDVLSFDYPEVKDIQQIKIIDSSGKLVKSIKPLDNSINVAGLSPGLYFFQLYTNGTSISNQFVIE